MHSARGELHMHVYACGVAYCMLIYLYIQECNTPCVLGMCAQLYGLLPKTISRSTNASGILGHRYQAEGPMKSHERPAEGPGFQTSRLQAIVCFEENAPRLHQARMISIRSGEECQCFSNLVQNHVHVHVQRRRVPMF